MWRRLWLVWRGLAAWSTFSTCLPKNRQNRKQYFNICALSHSRNCEKSWKERKIQPARRAGWVTACIGAVLGLKPPSGHLCRRPKAEGASRRCLAHNRAYVAAEAFNPKRPSWPACYALHDNGMASNTISWRFTSNKILDYTGQGSLRPFENVRDELAPAANARNMELPRCSPRRSPDVEPTTLSLHPSRYDCRSPKRRRINDDDNIQTLNTWQHGDASMVYNGWLHGSTQDNLTCTPLEQEVPSDCGVHWEQEATWTDTMRFESNISQNFGKENESFYFQQQDFDNETGGTTETDIDFCESVVTINSQLSYDFSSIHSCPISQTESIGEAPIDEIKAATQVCFGMVRSNPFNHSPTSAINTY